MSDQSDEMHVRQGCFQSSLWVCCSLSPDSIFSCTLFDISYICFTFNCLWPMETSVYKALEKVCEVDVSPAFLP